MYKTSKQILIMIFIEGSQPNICVEFSILYVCSTFHGSVPYFPDSEEFCNLQNPHVTDSVEFHRIMFNPILPTETPKIGTLFKQVKEVRGLHQILI